MIKIQSFIGCGGGDDDDDDDDDDDEQLSAATKKPEQQSFFYHNFCQKMDPQGPPTTLNKLSILNL